MKKLTALVLSVLLVFGLSLTAFAQNDPPAKTVTVSIASANVAGLPIPSAFDDHGNVVPRTQKEMGQLLNESGIDVICVQEDFQFHGILAKQMTNYPYQTFTSGGVPVGSGVNIFSKYPIYNVERHSWEHFNGIWDAANDALTPKGFVKATVDVDGVLLDVYDLHADANGSIPDCLAKKAQWGELLDFIAEHSAGRSVAITGDWNACLHTDIPCDLYPIMIEGAGFKDGWSEYCNDGVYFTGYLSQAEVNAYNEKFGGYYWGKWDSVERLLYRNGDDGANLICTDFRYVDYNKLGGYDYEGLTDHNVMYSTLTIETDNYVRPDVDLVVETRRPLGERLRYGVQMVLRCFKLMFEGALELLFKAM